MKVCVVGAGAAGCTIGGTLTEGGSDVWLIDSYKEHVDVMNAIGLRMRDGDVERTVKVNARTSCDGIGVADLVIVLVKSFHTRQAVESAAPIIGSNTLVMSLQNGLGHEDIIADVVGRERVLGGKTYAGGVFLGAGHVRATTAGKETIIGELDGSITDRVRAVADEFNRAKLLTIVSDNIMAVMWDRLLINVATGALSAITRLTYGGLYRVPDLEACATAAVAEGMAVARAAGVRLSTDDPRQSWIKAAQGLPPEFKASMLQSLENNTPTEIDFINGAVIRSGEKYGVPTPVNQTLVACVKGIEFSTTAYPGKA
ncbi:MAG: ketopantoate reductase family protein [Candidatus Velthaea sp.]|jgi:2-dehydropantoate 2-reductase